MSLINAFLVEVMNETFTVEKPAETQISFLYRAVSLEQWICHEAPKKNEEKHTVFSHHRKNFSIFLIGERMQKFHAVRC